MNLERPMLHEVAGYVPGEQPRDPNVIKLNTNENPYPPSPKVLEAVRALCTNSVRKYPDPTALALRTACAERYGYPGPEWVIAGNGMDELLAMALRGFVDPGDEVLAAYPTYSLYEVLCHLHGALLYSVDLDENFQPTPQFYASGAKLCFLTRPNAPSGVSAHREALMWFCASFPGVVVIDEAYVDFADDNCMDFAGQFENVIVMRTFSKSFALAGARVGIAVANPELIKVFLKIKDSYNINAFSQAAALAAIEDYEYMQAQAAQICATRDRLRVSLKALGFDVPRSQSNFLLAHWHGEQYAEHLYERLAERGILVRYFRARRLDHALRITVGTDEECDALLDALRDIVSSPALERTPEPA